MPQSLAHTIGFGFELPDTLKGNKCDFVYDFRRIKAIAKLPWLAFWPKNLVKHNIFSYFLFQTAKSTRNVLEKSKEKMQKEICLSP
jgi:hypothetical protein